MWRLWERTVAAASAAAACVTFVVTPRRTDGCYKFVDDMTKLVKDGPPSLINCSKLTIDGNMQFEKNVVFEGEVKPPRVKPPRVKPSHETAA